MRGVRILLGVVGAVAIGQGALLLLDQGAANLRATAIWLLAGVLLHDGVLAPLVIAVAAGALLLGRGRRVPPAVIIGAVVLGTVSLVAVPVLGRFGQRSDNATLLDRDYTAGWLVFAGVVLIVSSAGWLLDRRARARGAHPRLDPRESSPSG